MYEQPLMTDQHESLSCKNLGSKPNRRQRLLVASCYLLLGVFSLAPLAAAVPPRPLGVLAGSDWYWWSESSRANLLFAYGGGAKR